MTRVADDEMVAVFHGLRFNLEVAGVEPTVIQSVTYPEADRQVRRLHENWVAYFRKLESRPAAIAVEQSIKETYSKIAEEVQSAAMIEEVDFGSESIEFKYFNMKTLAWPTIPPEINDSIKRDLVHNRERVLAALADESQLPVVHVALTKEFFPQNHFHKSTRDGQVILFNGLTIRISVDFDERERIETVTFPNIQTEKQHIATIWRRLLIFAEN